VRHCLYGLQVLSSFMLIFTDYKSARTG